MSITAERIGDLVLPILAESGVSLYDLEYTGGNVRVLVDREGGIDLASLTEVTRRVSVALDEADLISSAYTLEVSSPGLERTLRTPAHFAGAVGDLVKVKTRPHTPGERRVDGRLTAADDTNITVVDDDEVAHEVRLVDIERAKTHFVGDAAPKPGKGSRPGKGPKSGAATSKPAKAKPAKAKSPKAPAVKAPTSGPGPDAADGDPGSEP
jgi:ribosome maturation factor RimP